MKDNLIFFVLEDFRACLCEMSLFTVPHCALCIALIEESQKQNFPGLYYFLPAVAFNTVSLVYMYRVSAFLEQNHQRKLAKHAGLDLAVKLLLT